MNTEIAALRGRLAAAEKTLELLAVNIDCDISIIRSYADPYETKADIRAEQILAAAGRLAADVEKYRALQKTAERIRKDLGDA